MFVRLVILEKVLRDEQRMRNMARRNLDESKKYHPDVLQQRRIEFHKKSIEVSKCVCCD